MLHATLLSCPVKMQAGKFNPIQIYELLAASSGDSSRVTLVALVAGSMALQKQKNAQILDLGTDAAELPRNEATTELNREKRRI